MHFGQGRVCPMEALSCRPCRPTYEGSSSLSRRVAQYNATNCTYPYNEPGKWKGNVTGYGNQGTMSPSRPPTQPATGRGAGRLDRQLPAGNPGAQKAPGGRAIPRPFPEPDAGRRHTIQNQCWPLSQAPTVHALQPLVRLPPGLVRPPSLAAPALAP